MRYVYHCCYTRVQIRYDRCEILSIGFFFSAICCYHQHARDYNGKTVVILCSLEACENLHNLAWLEPICICEHVVHVILVRTYGRTSFTPHRIFVEWLYHSGSSRTWRLRLVGWSFRWRDLILFVGINGTQSWCVHIHSPSVSTAEAQGTRVLAEYPRGVRTVLCTTWR